MDAMQQVSQAWDTPYLPAPPSLASVPPRNRRNMSVRHDPFRYCRPLACGQAFTSPPNLPFSLFTLIPTRQAVSSGGEASEKPGAWKWAIRKRIWDHLEANDIADFPRPVHHRIPNFKGAEEAARQLASLPQFRDGRIIKVNPDTPQKARRRERLLRSDRRAGRQSSA